MSVGGKRDTRKVRARVRTKEREDASWGYMLQRACTKERTKENRWRNGEGGHKSVGGHIHTHVPVQFFSVGGKRDTRKVEHV